MGFCDAREWLTFLVFAGLAFGTWICFFMEDVMNLVPQHSGFRARADHPLAQEPLDLGLYETDTGLQAAAPETPGSTTSTSPPSTSHLASSTILAVAESTAKRNQFTTAEPGMDENIVTVFNGEACKDRELDGLKKRLKTMPMGQIKNESAATFSFSACLKAIPSNVPKLKQLPERAIERPYIIWTHGLSLETREKQNEDYEKLIQERPDFVFVNYDLRDPWLSDDNRPPLPGVTMAPNKYYKGKKKPDPKGPTQYFFAFRGTVKNGWYHSSTARPDLERMFMKELKEPIPGVRFEMLPKGHKWSGGEVSSYFELLNATYALVPHGDGRWNDRFSEVIGACAIPVVVADGVTLPFSEIIDWSKALIQIPESKLQAPATAADFLSLLPSDEDTTRTMRKMVCDINDRYFATEELRLKALFASVQVYSRAKAASSNSAR